MKLPLLASGLFVAVGCSLLASPAHAATVPVGSDDVHSESNRSLSHLTLGLTSYDPASRTATVTVSGVEALDQFTVSHKGIIDGTDSGTIDFDLVRSIADPEPVWTGTFTDVFRGDSITLREGFTAAGSIDITTGPALPESKVTTTVKDGLVSGTYIHARSGWTSIETADGHRVASAARSIHLADGSYATQFTLPDTGRTSEFTASASHALNTRNTVSFTINDGLTSLTVPVPTVGSVEPAGTRALASITGEPGATVTVKDAAGKPVAIKILGASGTAQVIVSASSTRSANTFTVTQTAGGATSSATSFSA